MTHLTRRSLIASGLASAVLAYPARSATAREITWDDLIPPGVPYAEIIGEGEIDVINDTWNPVYDAWLHHPAGAWIRRRDQLHSCAICGCVHSCPATTSEPVGDCRYKNAMAKQSALGCGLGDWQDEN